MSYPETSNAGTTPRFGVNYVPSDGWFYSWLDLDRACVARDLDDIASLGVDHVRIFPIWPWLQPNRGLLRPRAVADVLAVVDLAAERGLGVCVDLLQGHLSSFDFLPSWVLTWHRASIFTDGRVRAGLVDYVERMTAAVSTRPNVFAVTLGNETNNLWPANDATASAATAWARELVSAARACGPGLFVVNSLFDDVWYADDHPFDPADVTSIGDLSSVHSWVFNGAARVDGPLGPATTTHADYLVELAAALGAPGRGVWLQEVGAPAPEIVAGDVEPFVARTVRTARENPALWGLTWWCSHDLSRDLLDFPEREYELGLFTTDHRPKPAATALAAAVQTAVTPARGRSALVAPVDPSRAPDRRHELAPGSAFHRAWAERRAHEPLGIVLPGQEGDLARLSRRRIEPARVVTPAAVGDESRR